MKEATTLPIAPQPLPKMFSFCLKYDIRGGDKWLISIISSHFSLLSLKLSLKQAGLKSVKKNSLLSAERKLIKYLESKSMGQSSLYICLL